MSRASLLLLGAGGFLAARRVLGERAGSVFGVAAPLVATAAWLGPLAARLRDLPLSVGFDARHHLLYAEHLLASRSLPDAAQGWATYHPPLFYALAALVASLGGDTALRALPFAAGLGVVWVAWWLARRLAPQPGAAALATLFAAVLPVNLYTAAYFSNEALHAALAGAALEPRRDAVRVGRLRGGGAPGRRRHQGRRLRVSRWALDRSHGHPVGADGRVAGLAGEGRVRAAR